MQPNVGEVTAGTMISGQGDRIYFGHIDGKVTIYSCKDYSCMGVVNVSLYKISCLVGVGDYLWAGYNTGMIYVYDTRTQPWKVKKDWKAHEKTIAGILVDRTSIWKLDRLQVASLGTDNLIHIWDGLLEEDWLGKVLISRELYFALNIDRGGYARSRRRILRFPRNFCARHDVERRRFEAQSLKTR